MEASALHLVCRFSLAEAKKKAKKRRKKQRPHEQRDLGRGEKKSEKKTKKTETSRAARPGMASTQKFNIRTPYVRV